MNKLLIKLFNIKISESEKTKIVFEFIKSTINKSTYYKHLNCIPDMIEMFEIEHSKTTELYKLKYDLESLFNNKKNELLLKNQL